MSTRKYSVKLKRTTTEYCVVELEATSVRDAAFRAAGAEQQWETQSNHVEILTVTAE